MAVNESEFKQLSEGALKAIERALERAQGWPERFAALSRLVSAYSGTAVILARG